MPYWSGPGPSVSAGAGRRPAARACGRGGRGIQRRLPERAPRTLEGAGLGIDHPDAPVAISVGDERFVRLRVDEHFRGLVRVLRVLVAAADVAAANLLDELPRGRELQDHVVVARRHVRPRPRIDAGNPDAIVGIDENAVLRVGPVVAVAGPAPRLEELSVRVELDHRGRGVGALLRRSSAGPMQHPHMVAAIDGHPGRNAHHPVVREPGRPRGIHLISRHPGGAVLAQERHMPWFDRQDRRQQQRREHAVPMSHVPSDASVCKPEPCLCQRAGHGSA